jgi:hypothetical protein
MQVTTNKATTTYRLRTLLSPQYEITPSLFVELINAQPLKEQLWKRIEDLINGSNSLNDRPAVPTGQIAQYLQSREGNEVYNFMVSQLVQEIQVELEVLEATLQIPGHLQSLLYQSDFSFGDENRYTAFLYPEKNVSREAIEQLVNAQPFAKDVWLQVESLLREYASDTLPLTGWPGVLHSLDETALQDAAHTICRAITTLCEQQKVQPIIPAGLLTYFGPDEMDGKRARARSALNSKQWYLQSIQQPWEMYVFTPVLVPAEQPQPSHQLKQQFISLLKEIAVLANKIQSPFAEAFMTSEFLLTQAWPAGKFDDDHENSIAGLLEAKGFSEQAVQVFKNTFSYTRDLNLLQFSPEKIFDLCAVSMADVFGGMGSWNDIDPGEDAAAYERLSGTLFETIKRFFAALLSQDPIEDRTGIR